MVKHMAETHRYFKRYSYLLVASGVMLVALSALLYLQFRSNRAIEQHAEATLRANLELRLLEVSERAKRGILDHANHIMHSFRQNRIRERNVPVIERILTTLTNRYPEVDEFYVVFFEPEKERETWRALRFLAPDPLSADVRIIKGRAIGRMTEDQHASDSLRRAWAKVSKRDQTTLYTAVDPDGTRSPRQQYFFHTVYENSLTKPDNERKMVGLLVFGARPERFPNAHYYGDVIASELRKMRPAVGVSEKPDYRIFLTGNGRELDLAGTKNHSGAITRTFEADGQLFPRLMFSVSVPSPELGSTDLPLRSNTVLGLVAAALALIGLVLTWRAAQSEMKISRMKSEFLASISHELKTPLTSIRAFGDLIHSGRSRNIERIREYGEIIKSESDRLTKIINSILEMSRLEKGVRRFQLRECSLRRVVEDTVSVFEHSSMADGFIIDLRMSSDEILVKCDEGAIRQAVINLLSNSVEYSAPESSDRILIELGVSASEAFIKVRDWGAGISPADRKHIFEPFRRSPRSYVRSSGGTGLGLSIANEIVKGHGGVINVESKVGEGSTFTINLPVGSPVEELATRHMEAGRDGAHLGYRG